MALPINIFTSKKQEYNVHKIGEKIMDKRLNTIL